VTTVELSHKETCDTRGGVRVRAIHTICGGRHLPGCLTALRIRATHEKTAIMRRLTRPGGYQASILGSGSTRAAEDNNPARRNSDQDVGRDACWRTGQISGMGCQYFTEPPGGQRRCSGSLSRLTCRLHARPPQSPSLSTDRGDKCYHGKRSSIGSCV
jgi:hypothetical protein